MLMVLVVVFDVSHPGFVLVVLRPVMAAGAVSAVRDGAAPHAAVESTRMNDSSSRTVYSLSHSPSHSTYVDIRYSLDSVGEIVRAVRRVGACCCCFVSVPPLLVQQISFQDFVEYHHRSTLDTYHVSYVGRVVVVIVGDRKGHSNPCDRRTLFEGGEWLYECQRVDRVSVKCVGDRIGGQVCTSQICTPSRNE